MFYEVIVPLIGMEDAVLVMISTPVDSFNFFTKLMNMRDPDTGDPLFLLVDMELSCARCKKRDPLKCTHRLKLLPPWKSEDKNKIMKVIMQDQLTILVRENMGIVTDEGNSLIPSAAIDRWLAAERFVPERFTTAPILVLTVDPNGGGSGTGSEMAICTVALMYGCRVVGFFLRWLFVVFYTPTIFWYTARTFQTKASTDGSALWPDRKSWHRTGSCRVRKTAVCPGACRVISCLRNCWMRGNIHAHTQKNAIRSVAGASREAYSSASSMPGCLNSSGWSARAMSAAHAHHTSILGDPTWPKS